MGIYEVVLRQTYFGQEVINRWNYLSFGTPAATSVSFGLVAAMGFIPNIGPAGDPNDSLYDRLISIQSNALDYVEVEARNLYDPVDFYTRPFILGEGGQRIEEAMSPVMAFGLRTNRTRTDIRRATKRFAGVVETAVNAGGVISTVFQQSLAVLGVIMSAQLEYVDEGNDLQYRPIVMSREEYTTPRGNRAYRKYETEAEQELHIMDSITWQAYTTVRTQVSRQYGRGR